jgi:predicted Zn-dependent protease
MLPKRLALLLAVLLIAPACAVNPATGDREIILMSEEAEQEIDDEGAEQVEAQMGIIRNQRVRDYVARLGKHMARYSPRQNVDYHFGVVEMEAPNAFALPGGHIYVSRGLLVLSNSEAELANVIGHEIGHVAARHAAQRDVAEKAATIVSVLGTVAAGVAGTENPGLTSQAMQAAVAGAVAKYGRSQESEADEIGQDLAVLAGVDPAGMADFLRSLTNYERLEIGYSRREGYFDSHPATQDRIAEMATAAQVRRWHPMLSIAPTRIDYLGLLDGLAIGQPASEGVFRGQRFLHADLGLALQFPQSWTTLNTHSRVMAFSPRNDAVTVLELQGAGEDPQAAAEQWAEDEELEFRKTSRVKIGRLPGYRVRVAIDGGALAEVTWVVFQGQVFRLLGAAPKNRFGRYEGVFRAFARSFRELRDDEREQIDDLRLRTVPARAGETLAQLYERVENEWNLHEMAVANGVPPDRELEAGFLVKIARREPYRAMNPLGFVIEDGVRVPSPYALPEPEPAEDAEGAQPGPEYPAPPPLLRAPDGGP